MSFSRTSVVTSTPLSLLQIPFVAQDYSSTFLDIAAPFIEPNSVVVEDILEDIHLLSNDRFITPIILPPLDIPL